MDFEWTQEQILLQDTAARFAEQEIAPYVEEDEKNHFWRKDIFDKMAALGFFGFSIDEKYGGNGVKNFVWKTAICYKGRRLF